MSRHVIVVRAALAAILSGGLIAEHTVPSLARVPASQPTTGTIKVNATDLSNQTGTTSKKYIKVTCQATIRLSGATAANATVKYSYLEMDSTTSGAETSSQTIQGKGTENTTLPLGERPSINLDGSGGYRLYFTVPAITYQVKQTSQQTGQPTPPPSTYSRQGICPSLGGQGQTLTGQLNGTATISDKAQVGWDWASIGGIGQGTITWSLTDPTLGNQNQSSGKPGGKGKENPTGKIKVTNKGIDATLDYKGWEISYSGDWKATQQKPGTPPKITSPDQKVTITLQEQPVAGQPSASAAKGAIKQAGHAAGHVKSVSYKPFAIGALTGQLGTITFTNSPIILLVAVVSDGQHEVITQTRAAPNTPPIDLLQAGMAIGTIQAAS